MLSKRPQYDAEKIAWLRLARTDGIGPIRMAQLISRFGSAAHAAEAFPSLKSFQSMRLPARSVIEDEIAEVDIHGAQLICLYEESYPEALRMIADPPPVLTVRGRVELMHHRAVGIVGTRNASLNGRKMTAQLARDLGAADYAIISGMARGIDTAAHEAALQAQVPTVAVLAGGVDQIYPKENAKLYDALIDKGAVIAESAWGTQPTAKLFPKRNRIVSGLSLGVVIVEAALRSGSLITARLAAEQGREVFAVPGFPLDGRAAGPNSLIQQGAKLVAGASDVLEELAGMTPRPAPKPQHMREECDDYEAQENVLGAADLFSSATEARNEDAVNEDAANDDVQLRPQATEASVEQRILSVVSTTPADVDELIRAVDAPASAVLTALMMLELDQKVERLHGNRVALLA